VSQVVRKLLESWEMELRRELLMRRQNDGWSLPILMIHGHYWATNSVQYAPFIRGGGANSGNGEQRRTIESTRYQAVIQYQTRNYDPRDNVLHLWQKGPLCPGL